MKKTVYGLFTLFLFFILTGCSQEEMVQPEIQLPDGGNVMVRFSAVIPEYNTVETRANGDVNDMYVLVFDQSGSFITREQATLTNQTNVGGTFTAELPSSTNPRIVHFICNYDWSGFNDASKLGSNEAAVVALLSTTNATFWARRELPGGIHTGSFPSSNPIELLRNQAKMSVSNDAANFTLQGFTIHNTPNMSSVAPFNTATTHFEEGAITEPIEMGLNSALLADISLTEKYLFERRNRSAAAITTVIIQGIYNSTTYYYKIDLIDSDQVRYNIERNYHYMVKIKTVTKEGYTSFNDALTGASHNNTALDPIIEKYPIISDGVSKLQVEKTLIVVTEPNKAISVWANYYPDLNSNTINNSGVTVSIMSDEGALASGSLIYNASTGIITATSAPTLGAEPLVAILRVQKGDLVRTIRVVLREAFSFDPITINANNPAQVSDTQNAPATLRFSIPADFPADLFPLPINVYTQGLYPSSSGLQMVVTGGEIHYVYMATTTGVQTVEFKTNRSGNNETVDIKADYFNDGDITYGTISYEGNITYGSDNTALSAGTTVTASAGSLTVTSNGRYLYVPAGDMTNSTPITFTYAHFTNTNTSGGVEQSFQEVYTITKTLGQLNNGNINFIAIDHFIVTGRIRFNRTGLFGGWNNVPSGASLTTSNGTATMLSDARYELITNGAPTDTEEITITYSRTSWGSTTHYNATKPVSTLRTNQYYELD